VKGKKEREDQKSEKKMSMSNANRKNGAMCKNDKQRKEDRSRYRTIEVPSSIVFTFLHGK
jgi:hypothetical protein